MRRYIIIAIAIMAAILVMSLVKMIQARRAKADLCDLQSVPFFHQPVIRIDFQPVKADLAMPAMLFRTHDWNTAFNVPPRLVFVEQKGRKAFSRIVRGARH